MKLIGYSVISSDGCLLSRLEIKPVAAGHELDVSFEKNFRHCLSAKKLKPVLQAVELLRGKFPDRQFEAVQLSRSRGQTVVDLPPGCNNKPDWIYPAVASLCDTIAA